MKKFIVYIGILCMFLFTANVSMALNVVTTNDTTTLANTIIGSGVTISNANYIGAAGASGTFTDGLSSGIGIDSGIILTSGSAAAAVGPNSSDATTTDNGVAGYAALDALIPGYSTNDATIFEFDFTTDGGDIYFNYVFASEEYTEWVDSSYNDVFGFFLDGVNIALIPGTSTAVSINNVNDGENSAYYNNNDPSDLGTPTPYNLEYDGFTDVFTASYLDLAAGTYHMELAIADAGDFALDSAVFIQAGTFSDTETPVDPVPEPATLFLLGTGLLGILGLRKRKK